MTIETGKTLPIWIWPHLLSLDVPLVAVVWQRLFAHCLGVHTGLAATVTLALCVWLIYAGDRCLDASRDGPQTWWRPRHQFYRGYWRQVLPIMAAVTIIAGWLSVTTLPVPVLMGGALVVAAVGLYLIAVHGRANVPVHRWPKELAVGLLFAAGTCIPLSEGNGHVVPFVLPGGALFASLCWLNCVTIEHWEDTGAATQHYTTRWLGQHAQGAAIAIACCAGTLAVYHPLVAQGAPLYGAEALSAVLLLLLHRDGEYLSPDAMRVLADAALLSPLPVLAVASFR